jgi:hypothetical protein
VTLPPHGTRARYQRGCGCALCRGAHADYLRDYRLRTGRSKFQREGGPAAHGTRGRYVSGCRCRPCTDAAAAYQRERYHARKAS